MKKIVTILCLVIFPLSAHANIIFSEIMYDPAGTDSGHEWVELYNNGSDPISIDSNWRFSDGSNHTLNLTQGTSTIEVGQFAIIADNPALFLTDYPDYSGNLFDSTVALANSAATMSLRNATDTMETITFTSGWGGSGNGKTLEKKDVTAGDDVTNWQESFVMGGTPGLVSSLAPEPTPTTTVDYSGLKLNEFLPDPVGDDASGEWIELYNDSDQAISLAGVTIQDSSTSHFTLSNEIIEAHQYLLINRTQSGIALNNSDDAVILRDPAGNQIDTTSYSGSSEGWSWALIDGGWRWSRLPTPGAVNQIPINHPPEIGYTISTTTAEPKKSILFDASTSRDQDGDELSYWWDFGDGDTSNRKSISHKYDDEGEYLVLLRIRDSQSASVEQTIKIVVAKLPTETSNSETSQKKVFTSVATSSAPVSDAIVISEFLPNPAGSDKDEWIELYNSGSEVVSLAGWKLDDSDGGSKPFTFPVGTEIKAAEYQVWAKAATKLSLNNSDDSVRLLEPDGQLITSIDYKETKEGQSYEYNLDDEEWRWQPSPTPGSGPVIVLGATTDSQASSTSITTLASVNSVTAHVIVPAGVWAKQKMYVRLGSDDSWAEVYQNKGLFPSVQMGDIVTIEDFVTSKTTGVTRYKIQLADQVQIIGHEDIDWDASISISAIDDQDVDAAVQVAGVVDTSSKKSFTLTDDSGESIKVMLTADNGEPLKKGLHVTVKGVIQKNSAGYFLRVISSVDITSEQVVGQLADQTATSSQHIIAAKSNQPDWSGWIAGAVTAVSAAAYAVYKYWWVK